MQQLNIIHAGGVGDGIMFSPIVKDYANIYDKISVLPESTLCKSIFDLIYKNNTNIVFSPIQNSPFIRLEFEDAVKHKDWRNLDWERNIDIENKIYDEITNKYGYSYGLIHQRPTDNCGRDLIEINKKYLSDNIPYINLDINSLKNHGLSVENILHYNKLILNAKEVHFYEGSFMNFTDAIFSGSGKLYAHLYCKQHLFNKNMVHNQIIKYITSNQWHKNKWVYLYEN